MMGAASFAGAAEEHGIPAEHGTEGGHGHLDGKTMAFQVLNFAVLVAILVKFGGGAINKALRQRHEQLKVELAEAAQARAAAEALLAEQDKRVANLAAEVAALRASLHGEAEREKARLLAAAEERVRRVQSETQFLLDQQVKDAERRFREEVAARALELAEEKLRKALQADDDQRLVSAFVSELETAAPVGRAS
jgi:F-type H+-transporting ATPase subunit b